MNRLSVLWVSAAAAVAGASSLLAVPLPDPVYTFCEFEDNDLCVDSQLIPATAAGDAIDCFFITGKLQEDCVWGRQPKCALRVYGKPVPARNSNGAIVPNAFCEPLIASSDTGELLNVFGVDGAIRLAVAAFMDALDGTVNGLNQNSPHGETGEVTIKARYRTGPQGELRTVDTEEYVFEFQNRADALRVALILPPPAVRADIQCCNDTGTDEICYDVDFYTIEGLTPNAFYCLTVIGGLTPECDKTDTVLGWFDKQWNPLGGTDGIDDDGGQGVYSDLCVISDGEGFIRFAISGSGDEDFNGLDDSVQNQYNSTNPFDLSLHTRLRFGVGLPPGVTYDFTYRPGASTKDDSAEDVIRYPRSLWDDPDYAAYFVLGAPELLYQHGVCGGYCIKVRFVEHASGGTPPAGGAVIGPSRADMNSDGVINAADLALLLSYWGSVL